MRGKFVIVTLVMFVWMRTLAQAEEQPVGISHSTDTDMIGKHVKNLVGKNVGKIKDLVISWRSDGYIEYAVLSTDGFWGLEDEYSIAVPWGALTPSDNREHFVLNVKEDLKDDPGFGVYRFYDRSSVAAYRSGRSAVVPSARVMKSDSGSDGNVSVAKSFGMPYAVDADFHRR